MIVAIHSISADRLHRPGETLNLDPDAEAALVAAGAARWAEDTDAKPPQGAEAADEADRSAPAPDAQSGAGAPSPADRGQRIREAVAALAADPASCTKSGRPTAKAIQAETGLEGVTAKERDAAFDALQPDG